MKNPFKKEDANLGGYTEGKPDPEIERLLLKLDHHPVKLSLSEKMLCNILSNNEKESLHFQLDMCQLKKEYQVQSSHISRAVLRQHLKQNDMDGEVEMPDQSGSSSMSSDEEDEDAIKGIGKKKKGNFSIDMYGQKIFTLPGKDSEETSFFNDLNYGDLVLTFPNPFIEFMFADIEHNELRINRVLQQQQNKKKVNKRLTERELDAKKKSDDKAKQARIKRMTKFLEAQQKPQFMQIQQAIQIYIKFISVTTEIKELTKNYMHHEKNAYINALILHSEVVYGDDLTTVTDSTVNKPLKDEPISELNKLRKKPQFKEYFTKRHHQHLDQLLFDPTHKFISHYLKGIRIDKRFVINIIRKILILKFNFAGVWTRQFYNDKLDKIFLVIKAQDAVLQDRARVEEMTKQLEIGHVDTMSLEVVDHDMRPYKYKRKIFQEVLDYMERMKLVKGAEEDDQDPEGNPGDKVDDVKVASSELQYIIRVIGAIRKLNDQTFLDMLEKQKKKITSEQSNMQKQIQTQFVGQSSIQSDDVLGRKEWEMVYVYYQIFSLWFKIINKFSHLEVFKTNIGFLFRLISQKAMGDTNEGYTYYKKNFCAKCLGLGSFKRPLLKSIWDYQGTEPIGPYMTYNRSKNLEKKWRSYEINEFGHRSIFNSMERIKLVSSMVLEMSNIFKLIELKFVVDWYPLHDNFIVSGIFKQDLFERIPGNENFGLEAGQEDFQVVCDQLKDEADEKDFIGDPIKKQLAFKCCSPSDINIDVVQSYFGEKIGLYFRYLQFYSRSLYWIGIIGALMTVIDQSLLFTNQFLAYKIMRIVFSVISVGWTTFFLEYWKRTQKMYAIKYGQLDFENLEQERPGFMGQFVRDMSSNEYNVLTYSKFKKLIKVIGGVLVSVFIIACSLASTIALLIFKKYLVGKVDKNLVNIIPALMNSIQVKIFQTIYFIFSKKYNFFENHMSFTQFEDSLIFKIYFFSFFNTLNSLFIIAFVKLGDPDTYGDCIPPAGSNFTKELHCYAELQNQVRIFFAVNFFMNFLELIIPAIKKKLKTQKAFVKKKYAWGQIDSIIQEEDQLESYMTTPEIDGVLMDYLEIIIQFSFLSLFGIAFPMSYFLAYLTDISEIHIDKLKLLNFTKRPVPKGASDIGTWQGVLDFVSFVAIFVNSGVVVFTSACFDEIFQKQNATSDDRTTLRAQAYVYMVLILLFCKWMVQMFVVDIPENLTNILKRHENIIQNTEIGIKGTLNLAKAGAYIDAPPNLQAYARDNTKVFHLESTVKGGINKKREEIEVEKLNSQQNNSGQNSSQQNGQANAIETKNNVVVPQKEQQFHPSSQQINMSKVEKPQEPDDDIPDFVSMNDQDSKKVNANKPGPK